MKKLECFAGNVLYNNLLFVSQYIVKTLEHQVPQRLNYPEKPSRAKHSSLFVRNIINNEK